MDSVPSKIFYVISTLVLFNFFLRLILIGAAPFTDEGIYAAGAYFFYSNFIGAATDSILPNYGTLGLYPLLVSWVYSLPLESFFTLRLVDALVSCGTVIALFFFLYRTSKSIFSAFITALLFSWSINDPLFIDAGFKNPIPLATAFLFLSLINLHSENRHSATFAGIFLAFAVLIREPFLYFSIVVIGYSFLVLQRNAWLRMCVSFIVTGFIVTLLFVIFRGGVAGLETLVGAYVSAAGAEETSSTRIHDNMVRFVPVVLNNLSYLLPLVVIGFVSVLAYRPFRIKSNVMLIALSFALVVAQLPEILLRPSYPYHYSQALIGLSIAINFGVLFLVKVISNIRLHKKAARSLLVVALSVVMLYFSKPHLMNLAYGVKESTYFAPVMIFSDWNSPVVKDSFYLINAAIIKKNSTPSDRVLVSGYFSGLFPLSRRLPPSYQFYDLSRLLLERGGSITASDMALLIAEPPRVFVASGRVLPHQEHYLELVDKISRNYSKKYVIPNGLRSYGYFSSDIYTP